MKLIQSAQQDRADVIREVCLAWMEVSPGQAKLFKTYVDEVTAGQYKKSGAWRKRDGGYFAHSLPADLWHSLRRILPDFGNDDKDIRTLCREFPDIFKSNKFNINT